MLGCVPGDIDEMLLVKDSFAEGKKVESPPFPTFYPPKDDFLAVKGKEAEELHKIHKITSHDIFHPKLFQV